MGRDDEDAKASEIIDETVEETGEETKDEEVHVTQEGNVAQTALSAGSEVVGLVKGVGARALGSLMNGGFVFLAAGARSPVALVLKRLDAMNKGLRNMNNAGYLQLDKNMCLERLDDDMNCIFTVHDIDMTIPGASDEGILS